MHSNDLIRRFGAEFIGTEFLPATFAGSGPSLHSRTIS
jgi:hypothetical protein